MSFLIHELNELNEHGVLSAMKCSVDEHSMRMNNEFGMSLVEAT